MDVALNSPTPYESDKVTSLFQMEFLKMLSQTPYLKHAGTPGQYYRQRLRDGRFNSVFVPGWLVFSVLFVLYFIYKS